MTEAIGFVGLGNMGGPMAVRLADVGYQLEQPSRLGERAVALWAEAAAALPPGADHTEIARWLRDAGQEGRA